MRNFLFTLCLLSLSFGPVNAQVAEETTSEKLSKISAISQKLQFVFSAGSTSSPLGQIKARNFTQPSLGQLGISYRLNERISIGISTMGSLGNCSGGYLTNEGTFISFSQHMDDDGPNEELDDMDDPDDDMDDDMDDDFDECGDFDDLEEFENVLATFTYVFSEDLPIFIQGAAGYSFSQGAPAYTALLGYNQKLFSGLGLIGGVRFSDVLHKLPQNAVEISPSSGFRAELGLSWNF